MKDAKNRAKDKEHALDYGKVHFCYEKYDLEWKTFGQPENMLYLCSAF